jgi:uncharacterized protein YbjT (DUF2867 family)
MIKILVTGATGKLRTKVVEELLKSVPATPITKALSQIVKGIPQI